MTTGTPHDEYRDVSENLRSYNLLLFGQMVLFFAVFAGLLVIAYDKYPPKSPLLQTGLRIGGIVATAAFWIMQERATAYWQAFRRRARVLEEQLGYAQYSQGPPHRAFNAANAGRVLFILALAFWIVALIRVVA